MDYQNTRDTIAGDTPEERDQAVLEGLVNNTLTELVEDGVAKLRPHAFRGNTALTQITLPNLTEAGQYSFGGCTGLTSIEFPKITKMTDNMFNGCTNLKHVIIRSSSVPTLTSRVPFDGTPIQYGEGAIYVPESLIDDYKNHDYWKTYFIADVDDYQLNLFESISDDWNTIVSNPSKYNIGDTKQIDLGTFGKHYMELVAKGVDIKSDGTGFAPTTWISKTLISTHVMYPSNHENYSTCGTLGWKDSPLRDWLRTTVKAAIPNPVRDAIIPVDKVQAIYGTSAVTKNGQTTTEEDVWIPSDFEVGLSTTYESTGARYDIRFPYGTNNAQNAARVKYYNNSASRWWLRSAYSTHYSRCVDGNGSTNNSSASNAYGVALGFCL